MSFGELVKQHRVRSGMNQERFAERVGITASFLRMIEKDQSGMSALVVARMVEVWGLTPFETTKLLKALREDAESKRQTAD